MIQSPGELHGIDRDFDIQEPTPTRGLGEFLGRLCNHGEAVVVQPVGQGAQRRVLLLLDDGGVVESADELALLAEQHQQLLEVNIKAQRLGRRVQVGTVNEKSDALTLGENHFRNPWWESNIAAISLLRSATSSGA